MNDPSFQVRPREHRADLSPPPHRLSLLAPASQPCPLGRDPGDAAPPLLGVSCAQGAGLRRPGAHSESARKLQTPATPSCIDNMSKKCDISDPYLYTYSK